LSTLSIGSPSLYARRGDARARSETRFRGDLSIGRLLLCAGSTGLGASVVTSTPASLLPGRIVGLRGVASVGGPSLTLGESDNCCLLARLAGVIGGR
jgi:hypothetical protein